MVVTKGGVLPASSGRRSGMLPDSPQQRVVKSKRRWC